MCGSSIIPVLMDLFHEQGFRQSRARLATCCRSNAKRGAAKLLRCPSFDFQLDPEHPVLPFPEDSSVGLTEPQAAGRVPQKEYRLPGRLPERRSVLRLPLPEWSASQRVRGTLLPECRSAELCGPF